MKNDNLRLFFTTLLCCALVLVFTGAFAAETRMEKAASDGSKAIISFADSPLKTMTETPFTIEVKGPTGITISDAALHLSLDMPAMPMPPNHPKAKWQDNAYRGTAIFTMGGAWDLLLNVQRPGYDPQQFIFNIEQVMMK